MGFVIAQQLIDQLTRTTGPTRDNTRQNEPACGRFPWGEYNTILLSVKLGSPAWQQNPLQPRHRQSPGVERAIVKLGEGEVLSFRGFVCLAQPPPLGGADEICRQLG